MFLRMIDLQKQHHAAVQNVHNTTADFVTGFDDVLIGELSLNPSSDGITFLRTHPIWDEVDQVAAFEALNTVLSPVGGLDSIIVFGASLGSRLEQGVKLAKAAQTILPKTELILVSGNIQGFFKEGQVFEADDELAGLDNRGVVLSATPEGISFEAPEYNSDAKRWNDSAIGKRVKLASHFDRVFVGFNSDALFKAGVPLQPVSGDVNSFKLRDCYHDNLPGFEDWEDMIGDDPTPEDWAAFKSEVMAAQIRLG